MKVLVTGAAGLVGSYSCKHFASQGHEVIGIDNFMRGKIFGSGGDTSGNAQHLKSELPSLNFHEVDIRDSDTIAPLVKGCDIVVHTAAQPSHPRSIEIPIEDFGINAEGTLKVLELVRKHADNAVFLFTSTNKVYGENPNKLPIVEKETRYDYEDLDGVDESMSLDHTMHTPFGVSKVAADLYCQEYGRLYGIKTGIFRLGCITGPMAKAVEMHNWEPYFVKANMDGKLLNVYGFKGKQVRDVIDARDLVAAMSQFAAKPRDCEVYNMGGGRSNSISLLESFDLIESITGKPMKYEIKEGREGDHQVYVSDLSKFKKHYPEWDITFDLKTVFTDIHNAFRAASNDSG